MNTGWIGVRFGLTLNRISAKIIAILFLLDAAISLALAPWVVGREIMGIVGLGLAIALAAIYLGVVRYAFITQTEELVTMLAFVIISVVVCQLVYAHPATLERVLSAMERVTPPILLATCGLFCLGSIFGILSFGGLLRWLLAIASLAALLAAMILAWDVAGIGDVKLPVPAEIRDSPLYKLPLLSALGLGYLGVLLLALSLRQIAARFHDAPTREYAGRFAIYHVIAGIIVLGIEYLLRDHQVQPVIKVGEHVFDTVTIFAGAAIALLVAVDALWLSRAVAGARDLINRKHQ